MLTLLPERRRKMISNERRSTVPAKLTSMTMPFARRIFTAPLS